MWAHLHLLSPTPPAVTAVTVLTTSVACTPAAGPVGCVPGLKCLMFMNSPNSCSSMMCSYCYSHFTGEEAEAPRPQSLRGEELGAGLGQSNGRAQDPLAFVLKGSL